MRNALGGFALFAVFLGSTSVAAAQGPHGQGAYSVDIVMNGQAQPVYLSGGQAFVAGVYGQAYEIRVHNRSGQRVEAVVAVDGRDVVTGQPVDPRRHRGHLVRPYGTTSVAGFRSSEAAVAQFRFSTIPQSYAWRTGTAWGIGTIRVWVFEESMPEPVVVLPHHHGPGVRGGDGRRSASPSMDDAAGASAPRDMGTEYGEQRWSPVMRTHFQRQSHHANAVLGIRYQSHDALAAAGILRPVPVWQEQVVLYDESPHWYWYHQPRPYAAPPPPGYPYY